MIVFSEVLWFEFYDHKRIHTPVKVEEYKSLLRKYQYNKVKTSYLVNSLRNGFSIEYQGHRNRTMTSNNLKLRVGTKIQLWNKVMKEVKEKRTAGPFKWEEIPVKFPHQSPLGLVPKQKTGGVHRQNNENSGLVRDSRDESKTEVHLIFHLSRLANESVNDYISKENSRVKYHDIDEAVCYSHKLFKEGAEIVHYASCNLKSAFRNLGICNQDKHLLVMMVEHPVSGEKFYFIKMELPFGCQISPKIFQMFSKSQAFLVEMETGRAGPLVYLDDFFTIRVSALICNLDLGKLFEICHKINFPVAYEKTCWASPTAKFLGLLLNGKKRILMVPRDKKEKAMDCVELVLEAKKLKMIQIQQIAGTLNFLCKAIVPGRAFTRRLYAKTAGLKQHHHVRVNREMRKDMLVWLHFLSEEKEVICRPFTDLNEKLHATEIEFFTDASKKFRFGGFCQGSFFHKLWKSQKWVRNNKIEIAWMELYALTVGILLFRHRFQNRRIVVF